MVLPQWETCSIQYGCVSIFFCSYIKKDNGMVAPAIVRFEPFRVGFHDYDKQRPACILKNTRFHGKI